MLEYRDVDSESPPPREVAGLVREWERFMAVRAPLEEAVPPEDGDTSPPGIAIVMEALLDTRDIVQLDERERWEFTAALARVDRQVSLASWPASEPASITAWRRGVLRRARHSDTAAAIVHALEGYHALLRAAQPTRATAAIPLSLDRVVAVRRNAVVRAWIEQTKQIVALDLLEHVAWTRYWSTVNSRVGTREDTRQWQRGLQKRAQAGSSVAMRIVDGIRHRDAVMAAMQRLAGGSGTIIVHVSGLSEQDLTS